jgi:hypothetical protein
VRLRLLASLITAACIVTAAPPSFAAQAGSVTIYWTASGDDGLNGRATTYDLRRSLAPITPANFNLATRVTGLAAPQPAGSAESFTVTGLTAGVGYYFALKAVDEAANYSAISNVAFVTLGTLAVRDPMVLSMSAPWPNPTQSAAHWALVLPEPSMVVMDAYDAAGRHVATIVREWVPAGQREILWDLKNRAGQRVAAGLYLVRASFGGRVQTRRLIVTR